MYRVIKICGEWSAFECESLSMAIHKRAVIDTDKKNSYRGDIINHIDDLVNSGEVVVLGFCLKDISQSLKIDYSKLKAFDINGNSIKIE